MTTTKGQRSVLGTWLALGAAVAVLAIGVAALPGGRAAAQEPGIISGDVPQEGFALLRLEQTATALQVRTALQERSCEPVSLAITQGGRFITYIPGAPAFVNAGFPASLAAGTPFAVRCRPAPVAGGFSTTTVDETDREGYGVIRAVRVASHEGFDRFVLEFGELDLPVAVAPGVPGYRVGYIQQGGATECGSGFSVTLEGNATLEVNLPQAYVYDPDTGEGTVQPLEIPTDYQVVREVEEICGFEGHSIWVLGLTGEQPFRITELQDPARLVIDIATTGQ